MWVRNDYEVSDPRAGKISRCPNCNTPGKQPEAYAARFQRMSRIPARYVGQTVDGFNGVHDPEALNAAHAYIRDWSPPIPWMFLVSEERGNGKTTLACQIITTLWETHRVIGQFWTVLDVLEAYRRSYGQDDSGPAVARLDHRLLNAPLLVLDDLGVERNSDWAYERLFTIVNGRYNDLRPTIVTSNTPVERLDSRLVSRIMDQGTTTVIPFTGPDQRLRGS